jgi:hypothetical protein
MLSQCKALFACVCTTFQKSYVLSVMQNCFHLDLPVNCDYQWYVNCNWNKLYMYDASNHIIFFNEQNSADSMV